jgi:hypothetical protein
VMRTIIVGSNHPNTAEYYKKLGLPASMLITNCNQKYEVGHTCIQDIPDYTVLEIVLKNADSVYWAESDKKEFFDNDSYYDFLYWLQDYNHQYRNVKNISIIKFNPYNWKLELPNLKPDDIIFLGGSTTAGIGLSNHETWYSNLIAKKYGKISVNLARQSSGIGNNDKTFDIFTQLEFNIGQMVIIHVTPIDRIRWCDNDAKLKDLQLSNDHISNHRAMLSIFNRKYLIYRLFHNVRTMIKLARLQKLKLVLWFDDYKIDSEFNQEQLCFYEFPELISKVQLADYLVDFAEDNMHPGIQSNQYLACRIIQHMERLYQ